MRGVNKAIVVGHLGSDIELRYTAGGTAVVNVSVATTERYKEKDETTWHPLTIFSQMAENAAKYLKKGSKVYVEGRMKHEQYEKDGKKMKNSYILVDKLMYLDSASGEGGSEKAPSAPFPPADDFPDEDIPF